MKRNSKSKLQPVSRSAPARRNVTSNAIVPYRGQASQFGLREMPMMAAPAAQSRVMRTPRASLAADGKAGDARIRVKQREYVADINGSVPFLSTGFSINPGLSQLFPWLSQLATRYESYIFHSLKFEYETTVSSTTAGTVALAVDYDAADGLPTSKQQMLAYKGAVRTVPWAPCENVSDKQDLLKFGVQRYIRSGGLVANLDIKTYDVGLLVVGTSGMANTNTVGELFVTYDVELMTPQLNNQVFGGHLTNGAGVGVNDVYGTNPTFNAGYNGDITSAVNSTVTFGRVGSYLLLQQLTGTAFTGAYPVEGGNVNATNIAIGATSATVEVVLFRIDVTAVGQTFSTTYTPGAATITASDTVLWRIA